MADKRIHEFKAGSIRVLGTQSETAETELTERLCEVFEKRRNVLRAYLVRVRYGDSGAEGVMLGLVVHQSPDHDLLQEVFDIFRALFSSAAALDVMFLDPNHEREVAAFCAPFFNSPRLHFIGRLRRAVKRWFDTTPD